jgi:hypothetical protein
MVSSDHASQLRFACLGAACSLALIQHQPLPAHLIPTLLAAAVGAVPLKHQHKAGAYTLCCAFPCSVACCIPSVHNAAVHIGPTCMQYAELYVSLTHCVCYMWWALQKAYLQQRALHVCCRTATTPCWQGVVCTCVQGLHLQQANSSQQWFRHMHSFSCDPASLLLEGVFVVQTLYMKRPNSHLKRWF